jgi:hypothetical protein
MIYTNKGMLLDKVLCDVIPCVCPPIDHGSRPMKALELLYQIIYKGDAMVRYMGNSRSFGHLTQMDLMLKDFVDGSFEGKPWPFI